MNQQAHVSSIESLALFRNALIVYLEKTRPVVESAGEEVTRAIEWLRTDRRLHWEQSARQSARMLNEAEQALFSAGLAKLRSPTTAERAAVQKAKAGLSLAEEKLRAVKRSIARLEKEAQPQLNQIEHLRGLLRTQLPKAIRQLDALIERLQSYAQTGPIEAGPATTGEGR